MPQKPVKPIEVVLPELTPFDGDRLEADGDYDSLEFRGLDLSEQEASGARFLECAVVDCRLDGSRFRRAHFIDCTLTSLRSSGLHLSQATWREVVMSDCRIGAFSADGSKLTRLRVVGGKYDYLNLRSAVLDDVSFEGCRLDEVDLSEANARNVRFVDCRIEQLNVSGASLDDLDLSKAEIHVLLGTSSLAGAVISQVQLMDLAAVLAGHLRIRVSDT
ncbi:MAG TPA: pentapeptide repeat-containing protein [Kineosporiaceae bacterium]|nr:pentapeptide repeat-containing protein [Kineosporiaceae bacterium]